MPLFNVIRKRIQITQLLITAEDKKQAEVRAMSEHGGLGVIHIDMAPADEKIIETIELKGWRE